MDELLKSIKTDLRLSMNGVASTSMREKGLQYKLNFGVELPRIKSIAAKYEPSQQLACALWKENIRECKILATLLQPTETFCEELADLWVEEIVNIELAELAVMNLFIRLPFATKKSFQWMASEREYIQVCGFLLVARLLMRGEALSDRAASELIDQAHAAISSDQYFPTKSARLALDKFAAQSEENAKKIEEDFSM